MARKLFQIVCLSTLALGLNHSTAFAGDPCPIKFTVLNLGPLGGAKDPIPANKDEIFQALVNYAKKSDCIELSIFQPEKYDIELGKTQLQTWKIQELLKKKNVFRCKDAHKAVEALSAFAGDGTLIYQRGRRRVLLTSAGSQTRCIGLDKLKGKKKDDALKTLWDGATKAIITDRYQNP